MSRNWLGQAMTQLDKAMSPDKKKAKTERLKSLIDIRTRSSINVTQQRDIATTMQHKVPSDTLYKPKAGASQ